MHFLVVVVLEHIIGRGELRYFVRHNLACGRCYIILQIIYLSDISPQKLRVPAIVVRDGVDVFIGQFQRITPRFFNKYSFDDSVVVASALYAV